MTTPIKHAYYILNGLKEKFFPITVEEAVYDPTGGGNLKNKLATLSENFSDTFDPEKSYTIGDICIYLNRLYRFTSAKEPGEFDGTKVIPISVSEIMPKVIYKPAVRITGTTNNNVLQSMVLNKGMAYLIFASSDYATKGDNTAIMNTSLSAEGAAIKTLTTRTTGANGGGNMNFGIVNVEAFSTYQNPSETFKVFHNMNAGTLQDELRGLMVAIPMHLINYS